MCGLFGFATNENIKNLAGAFLVMALENQSRGRDSWGVYNGKELIKSLGTIERQWHKVPMRNHGVMMGHVRAATVGKETVPNSHPFEFKGKYHVIGAHNGHISNWQELNKKYERSLEVDSMHIFAHIAEERPMDELEGSGAVTFIKDGGLYFSRFNNGTLAIAQLLDDDKKPIGLAWSSLDCDLRKALDGSGIKYETYKVEEGRIYFWNNNALSVCKQRMTIQSYQRRNMPVTDRRTFPSHSHSGRSSNATTDKRIIRLRVCREVLSASRSMAQPPVAGHSSTPTTAEETATSAPILDEQAQQLESIKKKIAGNPNVIVESGKIGFCGCGLSTGKRLINGQTCCLTCAAKMVLSGQLLVPETEQKIEA